MYSQRDAPAWMNKCSFIRFGSMLARSSNSSSSSSSILSSSSRSGISLIAVVEFLALPRDP